MYSELTKGVDLYASRNTSTVVMRNYIVLVGT